jgi:hypothetical protein
MSQPAGRGRGFLIHLGAVALGMMGVYLPPPPAEFQYDETAMAADQLEAEISAWLKRVSRTGAVPGPEMREPDPPGPRRGNRFWRRARRESSASER